MSHVRVLKLMKKTTCKKVIPEKSQVGLVRSGLFIVKDLKGGERGYS